MFPDVLTYCPVLNGPNATSCPPRRLRTPALSNHKHAAWCPAFVSSPGSHCSAGQGWGVGGRGTTGRLLSLSPEGTQGRGRWGEVAVG